MSNANRQTGKFITISAPFRGRGQRNRINRSNTDRSPVHLTHHHSHSHRRRPTTVRHTALNCGTGTCPYSLHNKCTKWHGNRPHCRNTESKWEIHDVNGRPIRTPVGIGVTKGTGSSCITWFFGPQWVCKLNDILLGSAVFTHSMKAPRQTYRLRDTRRTAQAMRLER